MKTNIQGKESPAGERSTLKENIATSIAIETLTLRMLFGKHQDQVLLFGKKRRSVNFRKLLPQFFIK